MISVSYVYDTIQTLLRKDQKGNSFNITEFNRLISVSNFELYNFYVSNLEEDQDVIDALKSFVTPNHPITLTSGVGSLPAAYGRLLGKPRVGTTAKVDVVTNLELTDRLIDELTQPTAANPIAVLGGQTGSVDNITVYPDTISSILINYLAIPATPILDFYIGSNGLYVYLDAGATGVSVPAGAQYSDGRDGPISVDSTTVDLEWHPDETPTIISSVLQKAGIVLGEQVAIEYGIARETKEEQQ